MKNLPILGTLPFLASLPFSLEVCLQCCQWPFFQVITASLLPSLLSVWPFFSLVTQVLDLEKPQPKQLWFGTLLLVSWPWELPSCSNNFSAFRIQEIPRFWSRGIFLHLHNLAITSWSNHENQHIGDKEDSADRQGHNQHHSRIQYTNHF